MHPKQFGKTSFSDICCLCGIVLCTLSIVGYVIKDHNGIDHVEKNNFLACQVGSCTSNYTFLTSINYIFSFTSKREDVKINC